MAHILTEKILGHQATALMKVETLAGFLKAAKAISSTKDSIAIWEAGDYKKYEMYNEGDREHWSPGCFGNIVEFLAEVYFREFGSLYNLQYDLAAADWDSGRPDKGIDHYARTATPHTINRKKCPIKLKALTGCPVFIQTKGTLNATKLHMTNDGSRITNFLMAAQAEAMVTGQAYTARYILFTTGAGIHYRLDGNSEGVLEIIDNKEIAKHINKNAIFWNKMRTALGLSIAEIIPDKDLAFDTSVVADEEV